MLQFQPGKSSSVKKVFIISAVLLIAGSLLGQIPKPMKNTYVDDFAGVLTSDQVETLNQQIFDIKKQTSIQFAVVLVSKLPADFDIEDYSLLIARKWHVGNNKNGLVYVAAIQQHKQRLEPASGLEPTFTPDACLGIMDSIKPSFRAGDYYAGLQTLINQVQAALLPPAPAPVVPVQQPEDNPVSQPADAGTDAPAIIMISFFLAAVVLIIAGVLRSAKDRGNRVTDGNGGYPGQQPVYYDGAPHHSGAGAFAAGAAAGYVARTIEDDMRNSGNFSPHNNSNYNSLSASSSDNTPSNWGNWGSGSSDSSNISSGSDSSSYDNSGFSGSDSSGGGSGATTDW